MIQPARPLVMTIDAGAGSARAHFEILTEVCGQTPEEIVFAGGASHSNLWPRIVADVLGIPVKVPPVLEATCLGAALCALVGAGAYPDLQAASEATQKPLRVTEPNAEAQNAYQDAYPRWLAMYQHQLTAADQRLVPYFWKGAGA